MKDEKKEVKTLNAPKVDVEGIEKLEERFELMSLGALCSYKSFGG